MRVMGATESVINESDHSADNELQWHSVIPD